MPDLLIELFSEEIPARMQAKAGDDLKRLMTDGMVDAGLTYAHAAAFATPRRLTLAVEGLADGSPTLREERRGPRVDAPEKALEGFLRGVGLSRDELTQKEEKKGTFWMATVETPGRAAAEIVAEVLAGTVRGFPWPKSMRWGDGTLRWVRPLRSILCVLTDAAGEASVVPVEIDGITAGDTTEGHRFMAPGRFSVASFEDYADKLKRAKVVLSAEERAEAIWNDATQMAFAQGGEVVEDRALLAEVAGLVEWPVVLMGDIDAAFHGLPPEVLQTSMREHQKFFSVTDGEGRIVRFVTVANRETEDDGATILAGNRKVLFARLSDAKFFWENDLRVAAEAKMEPWIAQLGNVTFHAKLGSQGERIDRIAALAREIAPVVGADPDAVETAARLAKADLSSEMVYEFPELQGVMGAYYAREAGQPEDVARVAREHYQPLGPSDDVPTAPLSVAVALADKIDTLTGFWAIDEKPTGSKDPFALRRAALGVIRLVLENSVSLPLREVFVVRIALKIAFERGRDFGDVKLLADKAFAALKGDKELESVFQSAVDNIEKEGLDEARVGGTLEALRKAEDLIFFIHERLKNFLRSRGTRHDVIDACAMVPHRVVPGFSVPQDDLTLLFRRAEALQAFLDSEDGENLLQGFKRANNILTQAEAADGVEYSFGPDPKLAETDEERALFAALDAAEAEIAPAMAAEDFGRAMTAMAGLRAPIDAFFEAVVVNAENSILRRNRLNLLHRISTTCRSVADLTRVEG